MNIDNNIDKIHTSCKDCVFAVYDNKTQTECALHYIELYKNKQIEILEAYDNDKEFYIINGKKCIGYRENKWFDQFSLSDASLDKKIEKYHETNLLNYMVIVDLKNINIDQLDDICYQISQCDIKPQKVIFIRYIDKDLEFHYTVIENILKKNKTQFLWRIQTILDDSLSDRNILDNIILLNKQYRFINYITNHNNDINNIITKTNTKVHKDLEQFNVISNNSKTCEVFSTIVYRFENFHNK